MSWSKVSSEHKKPIMWWFHKVFCELWWEFHEKGGGYEMYYCHLDKCHNLGFNLYGNKIV